MNICVRGIFLLYEENINWAKAPEPCCIQNIMTVATIWEHLQCIAVSSYLMITILLHDYCCHFHFSDEENLADKGKIQLDLGHIANRQQNWDLNFCLTLRNVLIFTMPYISSAEMETRRKLILLGNYKIIKIEWTKCQLAH